MDNESIIFVVTLIVTLILGQVSKKCNIVAKNKIPLQNITIGLIVAIIEFIITKDFKLSLLVSGMTAGGTYDLIYNLNEILGGQENDK